MDGKSAYLLIPGDLPRALAANVGRRVVNAVHGKVGGGVVRRRVGVGKTGGSLTWAGLVAAARDAGQERTC